MGPFDFESIELIMWVSVPRPFYSSSREKHVQVVRGRYSIGPVYHDDGNHPVWNVSQDYLKFGNKSSETRHLILFHWKVSSTSQKCPVYRTVLPTFDGKVRVSEGFDSEDDVPVFGMSIYPTGTNVKWRYTDQKFQKIKWTKKEILFVWCQLRGH